MLRVPGAHLELAPVFLGTALVVAVGGRAARGRRGVVVPGATRPPTEPSGPFLIGACRSARHRRPRAPGGRPRAPARCSPGSACRRRPVRRADELAGVDGLVIPGGESTTMIRLARTFELLEPLRERIADGHAGATAPAPG